MAAHVADMASNHFHDRLPRFTYFISYRIATGFDTAYITPGYGVMYSHRAWRAMLGYGSGYICAAWSACRLQTV